MENENSDIRKDDVLLCVDDEENVLHSLTRTFRHAPFRVMTASSGDEAIRIMENEPVRVLISDQRMPGMEGTALLGKTRERWPHIIRIILSGYTDVPALLRAINVGEVYRFISKPWDDEALKKLVGRAMEQSRVYEEMTAISNILMNKGEKDNKVRIDVDNLGHAIKMKLSESHHPLSTDQITDCLEKIFEVEENKGLNLMAGALERQNGKLTFSTEVKEGLELILEFPIANGSGEERNG